MTINAGADAASDVPRERAGVRCPECGTAERAGDFARMPWLVRRLPRIGVVVVVMVMLALWMVPRLTSPLGAWWPGWRSMRVPDGSGMTSSFIKGDYCVADVRALMARDARAERPRRGLARAMLDEVRTQPHVDAGTTVVIYAQPPLGRLRHWVTYGWPWVWKSSESMLLYRDGPRRTGLLADPEYPLHVADSTTIRSLSRRLKTWVQFSDGGQQAGYWTRAVYPLALLLPLVMAVVVFEVLRPVFGWLGARGYGRVRAEGRRRWSTAAAGCTAVVVFAMFAIPMAVSRQESTWLEATDSRFLLAKRLLEMPLEEFERLCALPGADHVLAERLAWQIHIGMDGANAVLVGTESGRSTVWRELELSMDSAVAGRSLVDVYTTQFFDAEGAAVPARGGPLKITAEPSVPVVAIAWRLPWDPTTRARVGIWVNAVLFWMTVGAVVMWSGRGVRAACERWVTRRRRRRGKCLGCGYQVRVV